MEQITSLHREQSIGKDNAKLRYHKPESVKKLEALVYKAKRERFPNIPYPVMEQFRDDNANGLTKCIIAYIRLMQGQAERISTTGRANDRTKTYTDVLGHTRTIGRIEWIPGTSTIESADIRATIAGRSVKIEVKIGRNVQSQAQKDYQNAVEKAGGIYYVAKDFSSFLNWYNLNFKAL